MKKTARIFISVLILSLLLLVGKKVLAQTTTANFLTISPPVRELELPRGSSNSYQMWVMNQGNSVVNLQMRASPFTAGGDTGGVEVSDEELPERENWVIINPSFLTLAPREKKEITYTITIPKNAESGGFYFAITALLAGKPLTGGATNETAGGSAINLNVASLNLVRIAGPTIYEARLTEFTTPKTFYEYGPIPFLARILNTGTSHIKPILEINIRNTFGLKDNQKISIPQQNILPQAQRKYEADYSGKWHFGHYAATLTGLYGDGQTINYTVFFWILPWKIILAVILGIVVVGLFGYLIGHRQGETQPTEINSV